ncbi:alpha/beta fold hydrolase [Paraburkholderia humisilvae]|uniref:Epoxide hydrolase A n=1 Tax=Paraburkholderia humisilvae TaxID=627669 RepID=A0A6J5EVY3_9BURK|nr:alpha/beta hydrolase [Paraburkholderia humisilvae]CAB3769195.1 Epoxide hydrolase A [Paraburkholderia humisilvae]
MSEFIHRTVNANGINIHVVEQGDGPAVLLCHGFPESWYSWRHQIPLLAAEGFRAIAVDMRGYGRTDRPHEIEQYTMLHLVGDMIGVLDALEVGKAVIVGHDWGAPVAWHAALLRPDRFSGVVALSVPFRPRAKVHPSTKFPRTDDEMFYQLYFQQPGVAEAEIERDVRRFVRNVLYTLSGDMRSAPSDDGAPRRFDMVPRNGGLAAVLPDPPVLPAWLTDEDIDYYAEQFSHTGFRGGLNWYRNIDRNQELLAPFDGLQITVPALFIAGERDLVLHFDGMSEALATLAQRVPLLRRSLILSGCGHWTQQERPREVNTALIEFLDELG